MGVYGNAILLGCAATAALMVAKSRAKKENTTSIPMASASKPTRYVS